MSIWIKKIERLLISNTLWIYLTLLLFISYLLLISINDQTFSNFIGYFNSLSLLFLPVLAFSAGRNTLRQFVKPKAYQAIWLYCFIVHPLLLIGTKNVLANEILALTKLSLEIKGVSEFLFTISGFILLTEIVSQWRTDRFTKLRSSLWLTRIPFEDGLKGLLLLLSFVRASFFCINAFFQAENPAAGQVFWSVVDLVSYTGQLFLISLVYYFFYYANRYFLIPKILKQKGIVYYGFSIAGIILVCYPIFVFLIRLLPVVAVMDLDEYANQANLFGTSSGAGPFTVMVLSLPVIISLEWFKQTSKLSILEKEKSLSELNFLKQQINPHFFFNTLNNLYALSITQDVRTPEVVLQLSELMRYVIYRGKEQLVLLQEEVDYVEDYIKLQRIRLHKKLDYRFEQNIAGIPAQIPPLLFIVLVENAFKHGI